MKEIDAFFKENAEFFPASFCLWCDARNKMEMVDQEWVAESSFDETWCVWLSTYSEYIVNLTYI